MQLIEKRRLSEFYPMVYIIPRKTDIGHFMCFDVEFSLQEMSYNICSISGYALHSSIEVILTTYSIEVIN